MGDQEYDRELIEDVDNTPLIKIAKQLFKSGDFDFITTRNGLKHEKQEKALTILRDNEHNELYFGGAAGGAKSWTGSSWLGLMCECFPETKWFIGRDELKTLLATTFITFRKVCKAYGINDWRLDGKYNFIEFRNGSRIDLLDLKFLPSEDPLYERYGSLEYTGGWLEEVGQVHFNAYDVLKSRVGRHLNDHYGLIRKLFLTGNPKKNFTYSEFYKKFKDGKLEPYKYFLVSLLYDNPHRESGYEDALKSITNNATKQRLLLGNFEYDDDPAALIDYEKIIDCFSNTHVNGTGNFITADIARFGADKTVIGVWTGHRVRLYGFSGLSISESAAKITEFKSKFGIGLSNIMVDEDGVGGGVVDILKCKGFVNNSSPLPNPVGPKRDEKGNIKRENYDNLKSQCYFRLAERINSGGLFIECDPELKETIIEELEQVKQKDVDSDKKKGIMPKDKVKEIIGRSPDYADTLMMREVFELAPSGRVSISQPSADDFDNPLDWV